MIKALDFLKTTPPEFRLALVSGEESFLRDQVVEKLLSILPPDLEITVAAGGDGAKDEGPPLAEILDDLRTNSLFGGEKLVHSRNADAFVKENGTALVRFVQEGDLVQRWIIEGKGLVARGAKAPAKTSFAAAVIAAGGIVVTCDPLFDAPFGGRGPAWQSPLSRWVQDHAASLGKRITLEDAYLLHRLAGTGLRELDSELRKLATFVRERKAITADDIEVAVGAGRLAPVFDLADAVVKKDLGVALESSAMLFERGLMDFSGRHVRDPAAIALTIASTISARLRKVGRVLELLAEGTSFEEAAAKVKNPAIFNDRLRAQVEGWRRAGDLPRTVAALIELERELKSGGQPRVLFDRFVVTALKGGRASAS